MLDGLFEFFKNFPPELATALIAMLPITELRASIPFAMGVFDMPAEQAIFWSVLGDIVPAIFIVLFIGPVTDWLARHFKWCKKLVDWWFNKVIKDFEPKFAKYGPWALMLFVAIPLPITGSWTGAVASYLFKIDKAKAIIFITCGLILSGVIVALISTGAFALADGV